jgi:glycosidase
MAPRSVNDLDFTPVGDVTPSPVQWRDQVIYQLLIDRFDNGQEQPAYDPKSTARHEWNPEHGRKFQWGCLRGITRRLDYIQSLGCTTLWISPPFKNRKEVNDTYHGYGIQHFLAVDPRFGTMEDLQELIREAHRRGMYVILDIIINHTGNNWGYLNDEPIVFNNGQVFEFGFWRGCDGKPLGSPPEEFGDDDAVWPVELQRPECYKRQGRIGDMQSDAPDEVISGDTGDMKDLDLTRGDVRDILIRCYKWWIAQTDCDGVRIDTVKHAEPYAMSIFVNAIREYTQSIGKHDFLLFAEIVAGDDTLIKYLGKNTPNREDADAQEYPALRSCLDFPLCFVLEGVIKGEKPGTVLMERYEGFQHYFRDFSQIGEYFVTFADSHDQIHQPYFRLLHGQQDERIAILIAGYLLTAMGIPCIYYGTEQGFDGGSEEDDDYVRETMFGGEWGAFGAREGHFFNEGHPLFIAISALAKIRASEPALRYGRQFFQQISDDGHVFREPTTPGGVLAYSRVLDTTGILIVMNLEPEPRTAFVAVDEVFFPVGADVVNLLTENTTRVGNAPDGSAAVVRLETQPREIAILKRK